MIIILLLLFGFLFICFIFHGIFQCLSTSQFLLGFFDIINKQYHVHSVVSLLKHLIQMPLVLTQYHIAFKLHSRSNSDPYYIQIFKNILKYFTNIKQVKGISLTHCCFVPLCQCLPFTLMLVISKHVFKGPSFYVTLTSCVKT